MALNTEHLAKCLSTLESALLMLNQSENESVQYEVFRNASIKGFELTLETSGKLLRKAVKPYFGNPKQVDSLTYKDVLRHAAKHHLLSTKEVERWFIYRDNRNSTAHDYGEAFAEETVQLLSTFILDAKVLLEKLKHVKT